MAGEVSPVDDASLLDLVDRVLNKGVVLTGDVVLSVADVDLVNLGVRLLLTSAGGPHPEERDGP